MKIKTTSYVFGRTKNCREFYEEVGNMIERTQKESDFVEVKYRQSDKFMSALIIGRCADEPTD